MSDLMLEAVLRMPIDLWDDSAIDKLQRHSRYIQAADELAALKQELQELREQKPVAYGAHRFGQWGYIWHTLDDVEGWVSLANNRAKREHLPFWQIQALYDSAPVPASEGYVLVPIELIKFLNGESDLEDCWFGEKNEAHKGMFWWRKYLPKTPEASKEQALKITPKTKP